VATAREHTGKAPAGPAEVRLGKVLFWAAMAFLLPAIFLGLSKRGEPLWEPARTLAIPGGALALVYAWLIAVRRARWIGLFADEPAKVARVIAAIGLGAIGFALDALDAGQAWRVLTIPMTLLVGVAMVRQAVTGRGWWLENMPWPRWASRAAFGFMALALLPVGLLWAVGLIAVD
jgi:hypothetical protein